jgi:arginyl-tRNA synthetase
MIRQKIEESIRGSFESAFNWQPKELDIINPEPQFGDFSLSCHKFSKELKKSPQEIAQTVAESIQHELVSRAEPVQGYINITVDTGMLAQEVLSNVVKIVQEYLSPNTNKPLHLGHCRNSFLGMAMAHILESQGSRVTKVDIINDRGIHIMKSLVAYEKWGENKTPEQEGEKGDHFVGEFYVMFEQEFEKEWQEWLKENPEVPGLSKQDSAKRRQDFFNESKIGSLAQEYLRKWEADDKDVKKLWKKMNDWVYEGFNETYKALGSEFDKEYFESETYLLGNKAIEQGLKKKLFFEEGGAIWVDLEDVGLDKKVLRRSDGTSVYAVQDIGMAIERQKQWKFTSMIYIVGHEQEYHFNMLFEVLKKLGYEWANNLHHLSYGLVFLPEGKMKSREGKVIDADGIIAEVKELARDEIKKRDSDITITQLEARANIIGMGALKFFLLRVTPTQSIHYNPNEAISFEGSTGPYVQYAHARISSILNEETVLNAKEIDFKLLKTQEEKNVIIKLLNYPEILAEAGQHYNPSLVCNYLLELSHSFNTMYHKHHVLKAETEELKHARLFLIKSVQIVLQNGLELLGIQAPEKM